MSQTWLEQLYKQWLPATARRWHSPRPHLGVEALEDRTLLSVTPFHPAPNLPSSNSLATSGLTLQHFLSATQINALRDSVAAIATEVYRLADSQAVQDVFPTTTGVLGDVLRQQVLDGFINPLESYLDSETPTHEGFLNLLGSLPAATPAERSPDSTTYSLNFGIQAQGALDSSRLTPDDRPGLAALNPTATTAQGTFNGSVQFAVTVGSEGPAGGGAVTLNATNPVLSGTTTLGVQGQAAPGLGGNANPGPTTVIYTETSSSAVTSTGSGSFEQTTQPLSAQLQISTPNGTTAVLDVKANATPSQVIDAVDQVLTGDSSGPSDGDSDPMVAPTGGASEGDGVVEQAAASTRVSAATSQVARDLELAGVDADQAGRRGEEQPAAEEAIVQYFVTSGEAQGAEEEAAEEARTAPTAERRVIEFIEGVSQAVREQAIQAGELAPDADGQHVDIEEMMHLVRRLVKAGPSLGGAPDGAAGLAPVPVNLLQQLGGKGSGLAELSTLLALVAQALQYVASQRVRRDGASDSRRPRFDEREGLAATY